MASCSFLSFLVALHARVRTGSAEAGGGGMDGSRRRRRSFKLNMPSMLCWDIPRTSHIRLMMPERREETRGRRDKSHGQKRVTESPTTEQLGARYQTEVKVVHDTDTNLDTESCPSSAQHNPDAGTDRITSAASQENLRPEWKERSQDADSRAKKKEEGKYRH